METPKAISERVKIVRGVLHDMTQALNYLISIVLEPEPVAHLRPGAREIPESVKFVLPLWLQAMGASARTIHQLTERQTFATRDCYSIARSVVEIAVNVCFVMAEGPTAADRALRHARQMSFKDTDRESKIESSVIRISMKEVPEPKDYEGLKAELSEFTSKSGADLPWIELSLNQRIAAAGKKFGEPVLTGLHFARFGLYKHSSEILHGSFFSALYFFGLTAGESRPMGAGEFPKHFAEHQMFVMTMVIAAIDSVVAAFDSAYECRFVVKRCKASMQLLGKAFGPSRKTQSDQ